MKRAYVGYIKNILYLFFIILNLNYIKAGKLNIVLINLNDSRAIKKYIIVGIIYYKTKAFKESN